MTRLNKDIKQEIVSNAIKKAKLPAKHLELDKRRAKWIEKVRVEAVGGVEINKKINSIAKRFKKAISELPDRIRPEGMFEVKYALNVNVNGFSTYTYFSGKIIQNRSERIWRISPYSYTLKADNPLCDEFMAIEKTSDKLDKEENEIRINVNALLTKVHTVKRLIEVWPESKELIPKDLTPKKQLPAISVTKLNSMVGFA